MIGGGGGDEPFLFVRFIFIKITRHKIPPTQKIFDSNVSIFPSVC